MRALEISGKKFGILTAICRVPNRGRRTMWRVICGCGAVKIMQIDHLKIAKSCGCVRIEKIRKRSFKHGHTLNYSSTKTFKSWSHAKSRCSCITNEKYASYGGRGITMCDQWLNDFSAFLSDMGERPIGTTLDRKNPNIGYFKQNCRWATPKEQGRTKRTNVIVLYCGEKYILKDFARLMRVNYKRLQSLVKYRNKTPHDAVLHIRARPSTF